MRKTWIGIGFVAALAGTGWAAASLVLAQSPDAAVENAASQDAAPATLVPRRPAAPASATPAIIQYVPANGGLVARGYSSIGNVYGYSRPFSAAHDDPEWAKLAGEEAEAAREADALGHQFGEAGDDRARDDARAKLAAALEKQFEAQQKLQELEISRIEARVRKLRELLARRNDARRTIVDKRLEQLVREAQGLGWNSATAGLALPDANSFGSYIGIAPVAEPAPAKK